MSKRSIVRMSVPLMLLAAVFAVVAVACGGGTEEVIREVEVERIVEKEVVVEVPVEKVVEKEVVKEVPVERVVEVTRSVDAPAAEVEELVVALSGIPVHVVGNLIPSLQDRVVSTQIYRSLSSLDRSGGGFGEWVPDIAKSWELLSDDTIEVKFEEGLKYHNGKDVTAPALVGMIEHLTSAEPLRFSWSYGGFGGAQSWEATDTYTFEYQLAQPDPNYWRIFPRTMMLEPDHLNEVGVDGYADDAVGAGPFKWVGWERDSFVSMERWEDYPKPKPVVKSITFRHIPEGAVRVAGVLTGEFDIAAVLRPEDVPTMAKQGHRVYVADIMQGLGIWMDYQGLTDVWSDKRVRQAALYAIDSDAIFTEIGGGYGTKLECQFVPEGWFGHNPDLQSYPYDPDKAKALLAEAGYADGFETAGVSTREWTFRDKEVFTAVQAYWDAVGIKMDLQFMEAAAWLDALIANVLPAIMNMDLNFWLADNSGSMRSGGLDPRVDELRAQIKITLDDDTREGLIRDLAQLYCDEAYGYWIWTVPSVYGLRGDLPDITFNGIFEMEIPSQ